MRASVPPLRPSARQLLFSFRASGNPHPHPRVSYYFPRVRYPPPPSARQLLSSFRASGTPHPHPRVSYYPPFRASGMRQALPTPGPCVSLFRSCYSPCRASGSFRASVPLLLPSARQLLFSFRASGNPHPHPCVSYYTPSARQVPPTPIYPRVSYYPPFRAPHSRSARQPFCAASAAIRPAARQDPIRASATLPPSARQVPHASYYPTFVSPSARRQLLYSPCCVSGIAWPDLLSPLPRVRHPPSPSAGAP